METLRRLRQSSDLPVIFLISKDEQIDELFGLKMGADEFIRKPFSQRLLVERVKAGTASLRAQGRRHAEASPQRSFRAWTAAHGPRAPHLHLEKPAGCRFWQGPLSAKQCMPETLSSFSGANRLRVDEPRRQHRPAKSSGARGGSAARRGNRGVGVRVRGASVAQAAFLPRGELTRMSAPWRNVLSFAIRRPRLPAPSPRKCRSRMFPVEFDRRHRLFDCRTRRYNCAIGYRPSDPCRAGHYCGRNLKRLRSGVAARRDGVLGWFV